MHRFISFSYMRVFYTFALLFAINLLAASSYAVEVKNLYVAKVPLASQQTIDRNAAVKQALESVLVKVTGQRAVISHPEVKKHLRRYNQLINNYRFENHQGQQYIVASFDQVKINKLLVDANVSLWGSLRPQIVLWLVEEDKLTRKILGGESDNPLENTIAEFSESRGMPIVTPLMDLDDNNIINTSDVWGRFLEPINYASLRYQPEAIVTIRISDNSLLSQEQLSQISNCQLLLCQQPIALDWSFLFTANGDETQSFSERYHGVDKTQLLTQALNDITDKIAANYALTSNSDEQYLIDVANVDSLAKYVKIKRFLQNLSAVQSVTLITAKNDNRRFSLKLLGSEQTLLASLKLNDQLKRYVDPLDPSTMQGIPLFYWESL